MHIYRNEYSTLYLQHGCPHDPPKSTEYPISPPLQYHILDTPLSRCTIYRLSNLLTNEQALRKAQIYLKTAVKGGSTKWYGGRVSTRGTNPRKLGNFETSTKSSWYMPPSPPPPQPHLRSLIDTHSVSMSGALTTSRCVRHSCRYS